MEDSNFGQKLNSWNGLQKLMKPLKKGLKYLKIYIPLKMIFGKLLLGQLNLKARRFFC